MPHLRHLLLPLATAALLSAGTAAHAEQRRSAQSFPAPAPFSAPARFSAPAPFIAPAPARSAIPSRSDRDDDARSGFARGRSGGREDVSDRGRGGGDDRGHFDNRRHEGPRDWRDYERGKDHEGHQFGHHDRDDDHGEGHGGGHGHGHGHGGDDSPGC